MNVKGCPEVTHLSGGKLLQNVIMFPPLYSRTQLHLKMYDHTRNCTHTLVQGILQPAAV